MGDQPVVRVHSFRGAGAVTLAAGGMDATFLPELGMLGASLRVDGREYLDLSGGLDRFRHGRTLGLPLLHPWANRLASRTYRVGGTEVRLEGLDLPTDPEGLCMHGTMLAPLEWEIVEVDRSATAATLVARFVYDSRHPVQYEAFPFAHELTVAVTVDGSLSVRTSLRAVGDRAVPVSFGFHPYFQIPGSRRDSLRLSLPERGHVALDEAMLPTGEVHVEPAETVLLRGRQFDDHYEVEEGTGLSVQGAGRRLTMELVEGYTHAQVYAPAGHRFVCLEPMTAGVDALSRGRCRTVDPGGYLQAVFRVVVEPARPPAAGSVTRRG